MELPDGRVLTFGTFVRLRQSSPEGRTELAEAAGQALGEIAAAAYESLSSR
ncbi:hypothetical protein ITP53_28810 [Nonomuraea sp. K274]|uniref:Uncharacterized protein n=1 Tax=Nonomuraea cypriaca TaxID=1187855 RepID=A0A931AFN3_9ACTN|nr:hypothetical protein [Nonomuraea cypriaca]MBF8189663.1 hypothetical protein [Nonomuraea cypriaca]